MSSHARFTLEQARAAGERIGIDWDTSPFGPEQFRMGMDVELEHGTRDPQTNVTGDDLTMTAGYVPVRWTVDTLGWEGTAGHISAAVVAARVLAALRPGEIVLMHVGSNPGDHTTLDADALPRVIRELRARGYAFVTLDALVG
jgi:peptidoglycan/xylan/chitin deacetylase (PgdA/CDA1 family)